jgi:ribulose-phosphate 3-epimerase
VTGGGRIEVWPSLLAADFADLAAAVRAAEQGGATALHCDVMDGHFVPNLTFGPVVVAALRRRTRLPLDVHLMVADPERWLQPFAAAGADAITVHAEATVHLQRVLAEIRRLGCRAGVALNPATPPAVLDWVWPDLDQVLLMTVNPGFGGQAFLPQVLPKLAAVAAAARQRGFAGRIAVDGGIDATTVPRVVAVGADTLVAGSAVYGQPDPAAAIRALRAAAGA